jgi:iron-sulfur cluster insertion protein
MNEIAEITAPATILLTDNAARKIRDLMRQEGNEGLMLRVYIQGGGCSGFEYGFSFETTSGEDDTVTENSGVKLLVDPLSFQYLMGASIDYKEDLQGARFVVQNPNASTTCGCGSSFSV